MAQYDVEAQRIKRQQMIADALRQSGNQGIEYAPPSGNRAYKHSSWQGIDSILQKVLGAYMGNRADKQSAELGEKDRANLSQLLKSTASVEDQGFIRPTEQIAGQEGPDASAVAQNVGLDADRKNAMRAAAIRGVEFGGSAAPLAGEMLQREILPPAEADYTLGKDEIRFRGQRAIARGLPGSSETADDRMLVDIVDPNAPGGHRTIKRSSWNGETLYHSPGVTVTGPPQETAESRTVGEGFGKQYVAVVNAGVDADHKIAKYDRISKLLDGITTGRLTPSITQLAAVGESLGIKVDQNLGPKQAAEALSNEIALSLRNPAGGAGMPGAMSDPDRQFLVNMAPGLGKTPEGNRLIMETAKKIAMRDKEVAQIARDYRKAYGHIDEGFYDELSKFSDAHPLFGAPATQDDGLPPGFQVDR